MIIKEIVSTHICLIIKEIVSIHIGLILKDIVSTYILKIDLSQSNLHRIDLSQSNLHKIEEESFSLISRLRKFILKIALEVIYLRKWNEHVY